MGAPKMGQLVGFFLHPPLSEIAKKLGKMLKYTPYFNIFPNFLYILPLLSSFHFLKCSKKGGGGVRPKKWWVLTSKIPPASAPEGLPPATLLPGVSPDVSTAVLPVLSPIVSPAVTPVVSPEVLPLSTLYHL